MVHIFDYLNKNFKMYNSKLVVGMMDISE